MDAPQPSQKISSPLEFDADGLPRSRRYGDVYFSREDGLAETRAVFLAGCGLPDRWRGRRHFTVAELGFGTGLNIAALLDLWVRERPEGAHLTVFSVEAEPPDAAEAARALAHWPELTPVAQLLLARWPGRRAGFHRADFPELGATLDLAVMDAEAALEAWGGTADAWFLDGFAPARNPGMWSPALMRLVGERSAPGAWAATYTVAGDVRRALADAGFAVERRPGHGRKRQRLEARLAGEASAEAPAPRIAIVGAGIAGAALARAFRALGCTARVFDAERAGAGASGNPAALVTPRLDAGLAAPAQLHAQAFARGTALYRDLPGAVIAEGALQLEAAPRDAARFAGIAASDLFEPGALAAQSAAEIGNLLGEPAPPGLILRGALVIDPMKVLAAWLGEVEVARISSIAAIDTAWRLCDDAGAVLAEAEVVILAAGAELGRLWREAPIQPVRGQLSWTPDIAAPAAAAWGAYIAPIPGGGMMFGATNDRDDADTAWRREDDVRNLEALAQQLPRLAAQISVEPVQGRAATRATTPDRLPLAGEVAPGLHVLGGFGARGFTLAPLLAEHLAAAILGTPSPLPRSLAQAVRPGRFTERAARRGPGARGGVEPAPAREGQRVQE